MRVLQALYRFNRSRLPAYVGQQVDVFIEVPDSGAGAANQNTAQPKLAPGKNAAP
jgi:hypothetical protein